MRKKFFSVLEGFFLIPAFFYTEEDVNNITDTIMTSSNAEKNGFPCSTKLYTFTLITQKPVWEYFGFRHPLVSDNKKKKNTTKQKATSGN